MTPPNHTEPPVEPTASTSSPIDAVDVAADAAVGTVESVYVPAAEGVSAEMENAMRSVAIA
jgi:hypothetical protein